MKALIHFLALIIVFVSNLTVQAQKFVWAKEAQNTTIDASVLDNYGNSYACGHYLDSAIFNNTIYYSGTSGWTSYIAKYDPSGNLIRVSQSTGTGDVLIHSMCIDNSNHIYITGEFEGDITFGSTTIHGDMGIMSYFIMKSDTSGAIYWAKIFNNYYSGGSGEYNIIINLLTCDKNDSLYIYGYSPGTYTLDGIPLNGSNGQLFFAKLNPITNTTVWAKQIQPLVCFDCGAYPVKILTDGADNVFVCGYLNGFYCVFNGTDTLNSGIPYSSCIPFISKYDEHGNYLWAKITDSVRQPCYDACIDSNSIYVVGGDYVEGYYTKYGTNGNQIWSNHAKSHDCLLASICSNKNGNYLRAHFTDTFSYMGNTITSLGENEIIFKTDTATGNFMWNTQPFHVQSGILFSANADKGVVQLSGQLPYDPFPLTKLGSNSLLNQGSFVSIICDSDYEPSAYNTIKGNVFNDTNFTCVKNAKPGLNGFGIIAEPGPFYTVSDSEGNYSLKVDTGIYYVHEIIPTSEITIDTQICPVSGYSITFTSAGQVDTGTNFPNKFSSCSFLYFSSVISYSFEACDSLQRTTLTVCNGGRDTARNTILTIHYPGFVIVPLYSSIPWVSYNSVDSLMTFLLSNLPPDSSISITIVDTAICMYFDPLGALNFNFHITPTNTCYPSDSSFNYATTSTGLPVPYVGIKNIIANKNIEIFPNPVSDKVNIYGLEMAESLDLYSLLGVNVLSIKKKFSLKETIDLTGQPPGLYLLKIRDQAGINFFKIIKQ